MNIFYLDKDPVLCAQAYYDRHVVRMCFETAQILCTVQRIYIRSGAADELNLLRATNNDSPVINWAARQPQTYNWVYSLFEALLDEYEHRFGKKHVCETYREVLRKSPFPATVGKNAKMIQPPIIMPKKYKLSHGMKPVKDKNKVSPLHSYRNYYVKGGNIPHDYTNREAPTWVEDYQPKIKRFVGTPYAQVMRMHGGPPTRLVNTRGRGGTVGRG